jgi:hypothetical protein
MSYRLEKAAQLQKSLSERYGGWWPLDMCLEVVDEMGIETVSAVVEVYGGCFQSVHLYGSRVDAKVHYRNWLRTFIDKDKLPNMTNKQIEEAVSNHLSCTDEGEAYLLPELEVKQWTTS